MNYADEGLPCFDDEERDDDEYQPPGWLTVVNFRWIRDDGYPRMVLTVADAKRKCFPGQIWLNARTLVKFKVLSVATYSDDVMVGDCFFGARPLLSGCIDVVAPRSWWGRLIFSLSGKQEFHWMLPGDNCALVGKDR